MLLVVKDKAVILAKGFKGCTRKHEQCRAHHFVCHDKEIELFCEGSNFLQLGAGKDFAHRVMRSVNDDHFSARSDGGPLVAIQHEARGDRQVTCLNSSKFMVQSLLVGFAISSEGECKGTYTGFPPLKVTDGRYWSKKGSNMITSSPKSRNAVKTEYCPVRHD